MSANGVSVFALVDIFILALMAVAALAGIVITLHDAWCWWGEWQARRDRHAPTPHPSLEREPWRETPELGSGKHRRLDYSDITIEEDRR